MTVTVRTPATLDSRLAVLTGRDRRVLDLGCGPGERAALLASAGCAIVGVELDPESAKLAEASCERMVNVDLDLIDVELEFGKDRFDVIVAAGVLRHLRDPQRLLDQLGGLLRPDGYLLAALPSVARGSERLGGALSSSELRFVTEETAANLFGTAGWNVVHIEAVGRDAAEPVAAGADPLAGAYHHVLLASPLPDVRLSQPLALVGELQRAASTAVEERDTAIAGRAEAEAGRQSVEVALHRMTMSLAVAELGLRDRAIHHLREAHRVNGLSRDQQRHNSDLLETIVGLEADILDAAAREEALVASVARLEEQVAQLSVPTAFRRTARAVRSGRVRDIVLDAVSPGRRSRS